MMTAKQARELFDYNPKTGALVWRVTPTNRVRVGGIAGSPDKDGYLKVCVNYKSYKVHRVAWLYVYGDWPRGQIDHINRVRNDNRICNLRCVPGQQEQQQNVGLSARNKSGFVGVCFSRKAKKWEARIGCAGKKTWLGYFDSPEAASSAYQRAKSSMHKFGRPTLTGDSRND